MRWAGMVHLCGGDAGACGCVLARDTTQWQRRQFILCAFLSSFSPVPPHAAPATSGRPTPLSAAMNNTPLGCARCHSCTPAPSPTQHSTALATAARLSPTRLLLADRPATAHTLCHGAATGAQSCAPAGATPRTAHCEAAALAVPQQAPAASFWRASILVVPSMRSRPLPHSASVTPHSLFASFTPGRDTVRQQVVLQAGLVPAPGQRTCGHAGAHRKLRWPLRRESRTEANVGMAP